MFCGLSTSLYSLKICYTLSIIGDCDMKVRIKLIDEPHSQLILQKLYDYCFIKRNVTQFTAWLKYFIDNYSTKVESFNRVYYIFIKDLMKNLKNAKHGKIKYLMIKIILSLLFSQVLEKETNIQYKKYLKDI